ncbi:hypothetical protein [Hugonella massiliensis]|jgi:hypothetical protein|uniref:hypothetical protein n=1 Tax=Hugonella massiliensis TaxID=1720315 RepID=UPI00073E400E|nr:hypothetical protein [Hugonella massiliensis]
MPVDRERLRRGEVFARYPRLTYSTIQEGLVALLVSKRTGRNGWAVIVTLCRRVYADGRLGLMSAAEICKATGMTAEQVHRGMGELRNKGIIVPVYRTNAEGFKNLDRSCFGHVAQYCFTKEAWSMIATVDSAGDSSQN